MNQQVNIFGFAGSLRKNSYNKILLKATLDLVSDDATLEIFDLYSIPPFNEDLELKLPEKVKEFKRRIKAADAILIVTPEYNYSIPGVLKNAIDWASIPPEDNSFEGKPVAIISASTGKQRGERVQKQLKQSFVFLNMVPISKPEVYVTFAPQKFDANGKLIDHETAELIKELLSNLVSWTRELKQHNFQHE